MQTISSKENLDQPFHPHLETLKPDENTDQPFHPHLQTIKANEKEEKNEYSVAGESHAADLEQSNFQKELKIARKLHSKTRAYIDNALEDVRLGQSVNTSEAKEIVSEVANSITRSPHAMVWLTNMKERDEYTSIHSMNVCVLAVSFGRSLGIDKHELELLGLGGLLHDLGKMRVPLEILNKPSKLTFEEFEVMKTHR